MKRNLEHNLKCWRTRRLARRNKCQIIWLPTYQGATWVSLRIIAIWMMVIWDGFTFYEYILPLAPEFKLLHANPYPNSLQTREWGKGRDPSVVQLEVLKAYDLKKPVWRSSWRILTIFCACLLNIEILIRWLYRRTILCSSNTRDPDTSGEGNVLIYMDVNMGYYNRQLAMESRPLTAVCFLFRKCQLSILPWEFLPQLMSIKHAWRRGLVIWKS